VPAGTRLKGATLKLETYKLYDERKLFASTVDDWIVIWNIGSLLHTKVNYII